MNYRFMGASDLRVSTVGLGTMSWPGCHFGEKPATDFQFNREDVKNQLLAALDAGINLVDTAQGYGRGFAEELLGSLLHECGRRKEMVLVTKVGPLFEDEILNGRDTDLSASHIRSSCEASLRRLRTDCIDLYLAHRPDASTPLEETCGVMSALKAEGKIRWFGVSNFSNGLLDQALQQGVVATNQIPYSLADRNIEKDRLPFCLKHQVGIMAYSPLGKGILTGKYTQDHLPPGDDYRHQRPHFKDNLSRNLKLASRIRELALELQLTPSRLVLAWALHRSGITTVIPGAKSVEQVKDNAAAGDVILSTENFAELESLSSTI